MTTNFKMKRLIEGIKMNATAFEIHEQCIGLNLNEIANNGQTPLMQAVANSVFQAVEVLIQNGADVNVRGSYNLTALHEAAANGEIVITQYLLNHGAVVDAETVDGVTPLMCAAAWGYSEIVKLLLQNGADKTKTANRGDTAADAAREKGEDSTADLIDAFPLVK